MKAVLCTWPDGKQELFPNAQKCADVLGVSIQRVSLNCLHGVRCRECECRYLNPHTGQPISTVPKGVRTHYTVLELARPAIEQLIGDRADEALEWMKYHRPEKLEFSQVPKLFFKWWMRHKEISIDSDEWIAAWKSVKRTERPL